MKSTKNLYTQVARSFSNYSWLQKNLAKIPGNKTVGVVVDTSEMDKTQDLSKALGLPGHMLESAELKADLAMELRRTNRTSTQTPSGAILSGERERWLHR